MACEEPLPSPPEVVVTATAATSTARVREDVAIVVTVHNYSHEDVNVSGYQCQLPFEVWKATTHASYQAVPVSGCFLLRIAESGMSLAAGQSAEIKTHWSLESVMPDGEIVYVSPGAYSITPRLIVNDQVVLGPPVPLLVTP